ncbi:MAG: hypothetical protein IJ464_06770 [Alistipes sp.]|nr:hypothetical protein [Alistipes sp.]
MKRFRAVIHLLLVAFVVFMPVRALSQNSRYYIKESIEAWGKCRSVAISSYSGNMALTGHNSVAMQDLPEELSLKLREINLAKEYIEDVQITDEGMWIVLYGGGRISHSILPESLIKGMRRFRDAGEKITSVSFNDDGLWIITSESHVLASEQRVTKWLTEGFVDYGRLWSTCVTKYGVVAIYEGGYRYLGEIPDTLKAALSSTKLNIYRLKIIEDAWFFADRDGNYRYKM